MRFLANPWGARHAATHSRDDRPDRAACLRALEAASAGKALSTSPMLRAILDYIVTETLAGRGERIKGYAIAIDALGRDPTSGEEAIAGVRVQMSRLRTKLDLHYAGEGAGDPVRIELAPGRYAPRFAIVEARAAPSFAVFRAFADRMRAARAPAGLGRRPFAFGCLVGAAVALGAVAATPTIARRATRPELTTKARAAPDAPTQPTLSGWRRG